MNQTLEQLIKLQGIDSRLLEIREHMGDLPGTVESQESEISTLQSENTEKQDRITQIEKDIRHHEATIEDYNSKLRKYKEQLFLVTSNKEYDALNQEIDHMKTAISDSEAIQLNFEEEKAELENSITMNSGKIETIMESLTGNKAELEKALSETVHEQNELEKNKNSLQDDIESNYLNVYQRIAQARDGVGMESIIGEACGGCYSQLPPQTVIEIKQNNKIIACPGCSVLLFWDGAEY